MIINSDFLFTMFLLFIRFAAIYALLPGAGSTLLPSRVVIMLALATTIMFSYISPICRIPQDMPMFVFIIIINVIVGIGVGILVQFLFMIFQMAGHIISYEMGFAMVRLLNPFYNSSTTVIENVMALTGITLFFVSGLYVPLFDGLWRIAVIKPQILFLHFNIPVILKFTSDMFVSAVMIAFPVMAVLFILAVVLGLLARTVPQMNVFVEGVPMKIMVGLWAIAIALPYIGNFMMKILNEFPAKLLMMVK